MSKYSPAALFDARKQSHQHALLALHAWVFHGADGFKRLGSGERAAEFGDQFGYCIDAPEFLPRGAARSAGTVGPHWSTRA